MISYDTFQRPRLRVLVVMPSLGAGGAERWFCTLLQKAIAIKYVGVVNARMCEEHLAHQVNGIPITNAQSTSAAHIHEACVNAVQHTGVDLILLWGVGRQPELQGFGVPVVQVSHSAEPSEWGDTNNQQYVANANNTAANFICGVCETAAKAFPKHATIRESATVIHNGSDVERVLPIFGREHQRRQWGIPPTGNLVLFVGRFAFEKRPELMIEAMRYLPENTFLAMVGWGALEDRLRQMSDGLLPAYEGLPRILFPKPRTDSLGDMYAAADVVALPSEIEAFPLVMIEAWQAGRPMVITNVPVIDELNRIYNHGQPLVETVPRNCDAATLASGIRKAQEGKYVAVAQQVALAHMSASAMVGRWETYMYQCVKEWHAASLNSQLYVSRPAPPAIKLDPPSINVTIQDNE